MKQIPNSKKSPLFGTVRNSCYRMTLLTVIAAAPLGANTVGRAVGDADQCKVCYSFGRLF